MNNNMRFFALMVCSALLTACAVKQQNEADSRLKNTIQQRSNLQFRYAQLADELWQRTGILFEEQSQLPIRSNDLTTLQKINQNLEFNINQIMTKLTALNNKIEAIKQNKTNGNKIKIHLTEGIWQKTKQVAQNELTIVAGEKLTWQLWQKNQTALPKIEIILSEKGHLYIDGQKITNFNLHEASSIQLDNVFIFAQQPFAIGQIDMTLIIQPIKLD